MVLKIHTMKMKVASSIYVNAPLPRDQMAACDWSNGFISFYFHFSYRKFRVQYNVLNVTEYSGVHETILHDIILKWKRREKEIKFYRI